MDFCFWGWWFQAEALAEARPFAFPEETERKERERREDAELDELGVGQRRSARIKEKGDEDKVMALEVGI